MLGCASCGHLNPDEAKFCSRCGKPVAAGSESASDLTGTRVSDGRYQFLACLGAGGMGEVWRAHDARLARDVALKLLHRDLLTHATARDRMLREAQALGRIRNVNVVGIHDQFEHDGRVVLALELVEGGDLADRLDRRPVEWREAVRLMGGILRGLEAIHAAGLVHRDLKPGNVLMDGDTPMITDLGVAHDAKGRGMTKQGARLGTAEYMSPEQIRGRPVDVRTDLYAAGIMMFEMLTGQVPFTGSTDFDVEKLHVDHPPDLSRIPGHVPRGVLDVTARALAKDPRDRWATAQDMGDALSRAEEAPAAAPASPRSAVTGPPDAEVSFKPKTIPPLVWAGGGAAVVLVLLLGIALGGNKKERPVKERVTQTQAEPTAEAKAPAKMASDKAPEPKQEPKREPAPPADDWDEPEPEPESEPDDSPWDEAQRVYRRFVDAYNNHDSYTYFGTYKDPLDCFYNKSYLPVDRVRKGRGKHFTNTTGASLEIDRLELLYQSSTTVRFIDHGTWWRSNKPPIHHHKRLAMRKIGGTWRITKEAGTNAHACARELF